MLKKSVLILIFFCLNNLPVMAAPSASATAQAERFERYYGLLPDADVQARIANIGRLLVKANGLSEDAFSFKVINSAQINAVMLPGGYIYIYKGLLDFMPTDEELAAVIGHEMGHVVGRHLARRGREQLLTMILGGLLGGTEGAIAASAAINSLPAYNQRDEREADDSGFKFLLGAQMNPYAMLVVMNKLHDADEHPEIRSNFAQHPEPTARAQRIKNQLQKMQISPVVLESGLTAVVKDKDWSFAITMPDGFNKPIYRAWLLAGNLYVLANAGEVSADKFIVDEQKDYALIYYDGRLIYRLCRADLLADGVSLAQKAAECVERLREWADGNNGNRAAAR